MDKPMVSICCITYNHEPYIRDCLEGFLMQKTNFPFEVLIHDDASTDHTADIIREYEAKYPDIIKPICQTENQWSKGRGPLRDFLLPMVSGKYIALCEGDDYWVDPRKLQKQFDFMECHPGYSVCATGFEMLIQNIGQRSIMTSSENIDGDLSSFVNNKLHLQTCTIFASRELFLKIPCLDRSMYFNGDLNFCCHFLENGKGYFLKDVTSVYRVLPVSMSHFPDKGKMLEFAFKYYNTLRYYLNATKQKIKNKKLLLCKCQLARCKYWLYFDKKDAFLREKTNVFFSFVHFRTSLITMFLVLCKNNLVYDFCRKAFLKYI